MPNLHALSRDTVFDRVLVDYLVRGGSRISWSLWPHFLDPAPLSFQLQVGTTGIPDADDWTNVGSPVIDAFYTIDAARRIQGGTNPTTHYRVVLTTSIATYTSVPVSIVSNIPFADWNRGREILRKEELRHRQMTGSRYALLKRRRTGPGQDPDEAANPKTMVVDPFTGDIIATGGQASLSTLGTERLGGFYRAAPILATVTGQSLHEQLAPGLGNVDPDSLTQRGRICLIPPLSARDILVELGSDIRYEIGGIKVAATLRSGLPLIGDPVELRQIPFGDPLYDVDASLP